MNIDINFDNDLVLDLNIDHNLDIYIDINLDMTLKLALLFLTCTMILTLTFFHFGHVEATSRSTGSPEAPPAIKVASYRKFN